MPTVITEFGHGTLTLGTGDLEVICQVMSCAIVSSNTRRDISTPCGTATTFVNEMLEMRLRYLQDWHTSTGISHFLDSHYNTEQEFTFSPSADGTPSKAGTLLCPRPGYGGDAQDVLIDDLVLPIKGGVITTYDS